MREELETVDVYIKYLEAKVVSQWDTIQSLEARILRMIHANRERQISMTLDEANDIINTGGVSGC